MTDPDATGQGNVATNPLLVRAQDKQVAEHAGRSGHVAGGGEDGVEPAQGGMTNAPNSTPVQPNRDPIINPSPEAQTTPTGIAESPYFNDTGNIDYGGGDGSDDGQVDNTFNPNAGGPGGPEGDGTGPGNVGGGGTDGVGGGMVKGGGGDHAQMYSAPTDAGGVTTAEVPPSFETDSNSFENDDFASPDSEFDNADLEDDLGTDGGFGSDGP